MRSNLIMETQLVKEVRIECSHENLCSCLPTKNYEIFKQGVTIGVDDSFEIISGYKSVPPIKMQDKGRLGLYTLMKNPMNIGKVYRCGVLVYLCMIDKVFKSKKKSA